MHKELPKLDFRVKDWGSAPRWVAFVDFFLASHAKYAVVSGAHRRVGTTYAQLVAALAATRNLGTSATLHSFPYLVIYISLHSAEASDNCFLQETTRRFLVLHFLAASRVIC